MRTFLAVTAAAMVMTACLSQAQVGSLQETKAMVYLASVACAGTTYNWTGAAANDNWSTTTNWDPNGYPGQTATDDEAVINAASYDNPVILDVNVTIKSLEITGASNETDLLFGSGKVLRLDPLVWSDAGHVAVALRMDRNSLIKLVDGSELWFDSDSIVLIGGDSNGGEILLAPTSSPAVIGLADGVTVTAASGGGATLFYVTATGDSVLTGAVGESNDLAETLVLHTGILRGNWTVDVILVNDGHLATAPDYAGHTNRGADPGDVHLTCRPKGGPGYWSVSGGDSNPHSTLVVDAALALSGTSFVDADGEITVNYPMVGIGDYYDADVGLFHLYKGGTLRVPGTSFFEYHRQYHAGSESWYHMECPPYLGE